MTLEEKKKFANFLSFIITSIHNNLDESLPDIVNDGLERYPLIEGWMDENFRVIYE